MRSDPSVYYIKDEEDKYTGTQWKEFPRIEPRYTDPNIPQHQEEEDKNLQFSVCTM